MIIITLTEIIGLVLFGGLIIFYILFALKQSIAQARCDHEDYYETRSCDAVCRKCGKNLGFIGTVREMRKKNKT